MNPFIHMLIGEQLEIERRRRANRPPLDESSLRIPQQPVTLRLDTVRDEEGLARLAALAEQPAPIGRYLVAEVAGQLIAALPLSGAKPFGDPFRYTAHVLPLLELRARQITGRRRGPRRRRVALGWSRA